MKINFLKISCCAILLTLLASCRSNKKSFINRAYHDVTAHYNGYFNAKLRIDNHATQAEKAFQDKYDDILPVFKIVREEPGGKSGKGGGNQTLDEAIKKASLVIQRHENSKWIDDCYFEIGRAYFYKKDYFTAAETFQFTAGKYKNKEVGDKSYVWLIKSYVLLKKFPQAESVINIALASETFPKKNLPNLFASIAWFYIEKKNFPKAIEYLEKAILVEKKKSIRARYTYITAQLYERINEEGKASVKYQQVVKMNPSYDLLFNARINSARLVQVTTNTSRKNLEKELLKMLSDVKNREFRDQIYYSLGLIYEKDGNEEKTINAFKSSVASSEQNLSQKGLSYYKIATIHYDKERYEPAQAYYDSASTFLPKSHPDYELVVKRRNSLNKLVENLRIIHREDSLLRLSKMPENERVLFVENQIKREKEERARKLEEEKRQAEMALSNMSKAGMQTPGSTVGNAAGNTWYFYNQNSLGIGTSDFIKKFGRRQLEDNWRRSNKESFASLSSIVDAENLSGDDKALIDKNDDEGLKKKYLAGIPTTPAAIELSTDKIVRAYYNIGQFYREEIINLKESVKAYETGIILFPGNKLSPEFYFNLYRVYNELNNAQQAEIYKNKLLTEYPNTIFAKVILDPTYVSDAKATDIAAQKFYENIYEAYKNGQYESIFSSKTRIDSQYAATSIAPKYYYLYALSQNKVNGVQAFEASLQNLLKQYPSSDAASYAREHLKKIEEMKNPALKNVKEEVEVNYELETRAKYYVMISTDMSSLRETKNNLFKFNNIEFSLKKLRINSELLGDNEQLLIIEEFQDFSDAKTYLMALNKKLADNIKLKPNTFVISIISEKNLKTLRETKALKKYIQFYNANYLVNE